MPGVKPWVTGCWKRESIVFSDGTADRETQVIWVQSGRYCGDIRVPMRRSGLAETQASLSQCHMVQDSAEWVREIAFHPKRHFPEPGLLSELGDVMIERAPSGAYEEVWRRQPGSEGARAAYSLSDGGREGRLVIAGNHLFLALDRPVPLTGDVTLQEMLAAGGDPAVLFDCEFSYACRVDWTAPYVVQLSTVPDREGQALGDVFEGARWIPVDDGGMA